MIIACGCKNGPNGVVIAALQQDGWYGTGNRVHNETAKEKVYRCTVCGHEVNKSTEQKAAPEGKPKKK